MNYEQLAAMVLATGALGTAAFGIVEALKFTWLGLLGYWRVFRTLGPDVKGAIETAYGPKFSILLRGLYRRDRAGGGIGKALRQGVRVGLTKNNARALATSVGVVKPDQLVAAAVAIQEGKVGDAERSTIGRFELAIDARIDAALATANASYVGWIRVSASIVAFLLVWGATTTMENVNTVHAVIVGAVAVPIAPIVKDLATGITSARRALGAKP